MKLEIEVPDHFAEMNDYVLARHVQDIELIVRHSFPAETPRCFLYPDEKKPGTFRQIWR